MDLLLNPNVAYVLLVIGVVLGLLALVQPGTGLLEVGTLFCLTLAGYAAYNLGLNLWALGLIVLSIVPFLLALRSKLPRVPLVTLTILLVIGGSVFLFPAQSGSLISVDPFLATIVSLLTGGFLWVSSDRILVALHAPIRNDPNRLIGTLGEAKTDIHEEGSVQASGELWSARSESPIRAGTEIRILRREGFVLVVEKAQK